MVKRGLVVAVFLSLLIFNIFFVSGAENSSGGSVQDRAQAVSSLNNKILDEGERTKYLKEEWGKLLNETSIGPYLTKTQSALNSLDPAFNVLIGIPFAFSVEFFLTIIFWFVLLYMAWNFSIPLMVYASEKYSKYARIAAFLIFFIIISSVRIPFYLALLAVTTISFLPNWSVQLIISVILVVGVVFLANYSKAFKKQFIEVKRVRDINQSKQTSKEVQAKQDAMSKNLMTGKYDRKTLKEQAETQAEEDLEGLGESA